MRAEPKIEADKRTGTGRLNSWKEIATFFERDVRTVRRWEDTRGLPVHRMPGGGRSGVYAYVSELERWMRDAPAEVPEASVPDFVDDPAGEETRAIALPPAEAVPEPHEAAPESPDQLQPAPIAVPARMARIWWRVAISFALLAAVAVSTYLIRGGARSHGLADPQEKPGRPSANAEAQELYLKALYLWNQRTEQSLTDAVDLFTQAIVHDPHFAAAYAGLADSYLLQRQYGNMADSEAFPRALAAVEQALALDDSSPQAHRSYAFVLNYWLWDSANAEKEFRRSLDLNNEDAQTHSWYATSLYSQGRYTDALREIDQARQLQPDSITVLANRGLLLAALDLPGAADYLRELERINPTFANVPLYLSGVDLALGKDREFIEEWRKAAALHGSKDELSLVDEAAKQLASHGRVAMLQTIASGYGKRADAGAPGAMIAAGFYGRAGDQPSTLHYLRLGYERRESAFLSISHDPAYQGLHGNPEYEALVAKRNTPLSLADASRIAGAVSSKSQAAQAAPTK